MKRFSLVCGICLLGCAIPGESTAQQVVRGQNAAVSQRQALSKEATRQMYEDIEIMKRLLNQQFARVEMHTCTKCHSARAAASNLLFQQITPRITANGSSLDLTLRSGSHPPLPNADGVYLPGQGVVYQISLSSETARKHKVTQKPASNTISAWDKVRQQLRGHKVTSSSKTKTPVLDLEDTLLRTLAEHGHNFSHLSSGKTITVAIAFERQPHHKSMPAMMQNPLVGNLSRSTPTLTRNRIALLAQGGLPLASQKSPARDYTLLGDFHLKQGKHNAALDNYKKALQNAVTTKQKRELYRKIAAVYLQGAAVPNTEVKTQMMDMALAYLQKFKNSQDSKEPAVKKTIALPSRLIITVSKTDLDAVAKGRMNLATFRNNARVQWLRFTSSDNQPPNQQQQLPGARSRQNGLPDGG